MAYIPYGVLGAAIILIVSCKNIKTDKTGNIAVLPNNVSFVQSHFKMFGDVKTHVDENYLYVSSDGLPVNEMMVGIKNWQQQVPIRQNYTGSK